MVERTRLGYAESADEAEARNTALRAVASTGPLWPIISQSPEGSCGWDHEWARNARYSGELVCHAFAYYVLDVGERIRDPGPEFHRAKRLHGGMSPAQANRWTIDLAAHPGEGHDWNAPEVAAVTPVGDAYVSRCRRPGCERVARWGLYPAAAAPSYLAIPNALATVTCPVCSLHFPLALVGAENIAVATCHGYRMSAQLRADGSIATASDLRYVED